MENELVGFESEVIRKAATYADVVYQYVKGISPQAIADDFEIDVKKVLTVLDRAEKAGHLKLSLDELVAKGATPENAEPRTISLKLDPATPATPVPAAPAPASDILGAPTASDKPQTAPQSQPTTPAAPSAGDTTANNPSQPTGGVQGV